MSRLNREIMVGSVHHYHFVSTVKRRFVPAFLHLFIAVMILKGVDMMKQSKLFMSTKQQRKNTQTMNAEQLLIAGCFIREVGEGIYSFLPLGIKLFDKIQKIIHEKLEKERAIRFQSSLMQAVGEGKEVQKGQFTVTDQYDRQYLLSNALSVVDAPFLATQLHVPGKGSSLYYQVTTEFEKVNKTACSLWNSREKTIFEMYGLELTDDEMIIVKELFSSLLSTLHIQQYPIIESENEKEQTIRFIAVEPKGDVKLAYYSVGDYAQKIELAAAKQVYEHQEDEPLPMEKVELRDVETSEDIAEALDISLEQVLTTSLYEADGRLVVVVCRADYEVSLAKLQKTLQATKVKKASAKQVKELFSVEGLCIGPTQLPVGTEVVADYSVTSVINGITGANEPSLFNQFVKPERDFAVHQYADLRYVQEGEEAPNGQGVVQFANGIDIGKSMNLFVETDEEASIAIRYHRMDLTKMFAILASQHRDELGFMWPKSLAPFDVHLLVENEQNSAQYEVAQSLYALLRSYHYEVLYDDREISLEQKQLDANLIGMPVQIVIDDDIEQRLLNVMMRKTAETSTWQLEEVTEKLQSYFTMNE